MYQSVTLMGRLGADPELRYIQNGAAVASLSLATSKSTFIKETKTYKSDTQWHKVKVWGQLGEKVNQEAKKGSQLFVAGEIKYSESQGKDGTKRYYTDIVAKTVRFLDRKEKVDSPKVETVSKNFSDQRFTSDDIPF